MAEQNKTKLGIGLILIIGAFFCIGVIFYFMGKMHQASQEKIADLQLQLTNLINERAGTRMNAKDAARASGVPLSLEDLLKKSASMYSDNEKKQREGFLWIDREGKAMVITLGALNGLRSGSRLSVYDGQAKIDEVVVDTLFDVISYVAPANNKLEQYQGNYYRVVNDAPAEPAGSAKDEAAAPQAQASPPNPKK